jgi:hypothetical protein
LIESQRGFNAWKCLFNKNKLLLKKRVRLPQVGFFDCHPKPQREAELLEKSESFRVSRPPRQPISLGIDPLDLSILKRIARRKGIPFTPLLFMWVQEKSSKKGLNPIPGLLTNNIPPLKILIPVC